MRKIIYTWRKFDRDVQKILKLVNFEEYKSLAPVAFGGLILGTKLKNITKLPTRIIFASSYKEKQRETLKIKLGDLTKLKQRILVLEDVVDSGNTILHIRRFCKKNNIEYDILALFYKEQAVLSPKYYLHKVPDSSWISFPWE